MITAIHAGGTLELPAGCTGQHPAGYCPILPPSLPKRSCHHEDKRYMHCLLGRLSRLAAQLLEVNMDAGDILFFRGDLLHTGMGYVEENIRYLVCLQVCHCSAGCTCTLTAPRWVKKRIRLTLSLLNGPSTPGSGCLAFNEEYKTLTSSV